MRWSAGAWLKGRTIESASIGTIKSDKEVSIDLVDNSFPAGGILVNAEREVREDVRHGRPW